MILAVYLIVFIVYFCCPKFLKLIIFLVNIFLPDSIPLLDEVVMVLGLLKSE